MILVLMCAIACIVNPYLELLRKLNRRGRLFLFTMPHWSNMYVIIASYMQLFFYLPFSPTKTAVWEGGITVACLCSEMLLFWQGTKLSPPVNPDIKLRKTRDLAFYETVDKAIWFTQPDWELRKTRDVVFNDALLKYKNPLFPRTIVISEMLQFIWLNLKLWPRFIDGIDGGS